jgi:hypothetical protein
VRQQPREPDPSAAEAHQPAPFRQHRSARSGNGNSRAAAHSEDGVGTHPRGCARRADPAVGERHRRGEARSASGRAPKVKLSCPTIRTCAWSGCAGLRIALYSAGRTAEGTHRRALTRAVSHRVPWSRAGIGANLTPAGRKLVLRPGRPGHGVRDRDRQQDEIRGDAARGGVDQRLQNRECAVLGCVHGSGARVVPPPTRESSPLATKVGARSAGDAVDGRHQV